MYDELERAVGGGRPRRGWSILGAFLALSALFVVGGVVAAGFAMRSAVSRVESLARSFEAGALSTGAELAARLAGSRELLALEPAGGVAFLRTLDEGDPGAAFLAERIRTDFGRDRFLAPARNLGEQAAGAATEPGEGDEGGFLVLGSGEDRVRLDFARNPDGGNLTIRSRDGESRFDLVRSEQGGVLTIRSDGEEVRFDLQRSDEGGTLTVESSGETLRVGVGDRARGVPGWVPLLPGMEGALAPVYSLEGGEGVLGGASWEGSASPREVMDIYRTRLQGEGYELEMQHGRRDGTGDEGSLWARNPDTGRVVFVLARGDDGGSRVLLGYGEGER